MMVHFGQPGAALGTYSLVIPSSDDASSINGQGQDTMLRPIHSSSESATGPPFMPLASEVDAEPATSSSAPGMVNHSSILDRMSAHTAVLMNKQGFPASSPSSAKAIISTAMSERRESTMSTASTSSTFDMEDPCSLWPRRRRTRMSREMRVVMLALGCALLCGMAMGYMLSDYYLPGTIIDDLSFALGGTGTPGQPQQQQHQQYAGAAQASGGWWDGTDGDEASWGGDIQDVERLKHIVPVLDDPDHVLVPILPLDPPAPLLQPLASRMPHDILTSWYLTGMIPDSATPENTPRQEPLDLVYLFVNASSPFFREEITQRARAEGLYFQPNSHRWRDNGELRGAIRSATASLGDGLRKIHVLSGDYDFDHEEYRDLLPYRDEIDLEAGIEGWKMGQIPEWLDWERVQAGETRLTWHFHSDVYRLPSDHGIVPSDIISEYWQPGDDEERRKRSMTPEAAVEISEYVEDVWRDQALPTFNSFEIESRVGWISGLSENFISSNDDMFMLAEMSTADFYQPLMGHVFRLEPYTGLLVPPVLTPNRLSTDGEWGGLQHASLLVSMRFPARSRMYSLHMPKSLSKAVVQETSVMFAHDLTLAATRGFRQSRRGRADVEISWLAMHVQIERWREALLWSWIVAKVGGESGIWGADARRQLRDVLKLSDDYDGWSNVVVEKGPRSTLFDVMGAQQQVDWEGPKRTRWIFSSMDGHLPWNANQLQLETCSFAMDTCLPHGFMDDTTPYSASEIFRNITFAKADCGDCLITALVAASGQRGLSAFLPNADATYVPDRRRRSMWERSEPILPMTRTWQEADFSMKHVVRPGQDVWHGIQPRADGAVRMREWCIKLLSRYAFSYATTSSHFGQIERYNKLVTTLKDIDDRPEIAMLCLNDDQPDGDMEPSKKLLGDWMQNRWGSVPAEWERKLGRTKLFTERTIRDRLSRAMIATDVNSTYT